MIQYTIFGRDIPILFVEFPQFESQCWRFLKENVESQSLGLSRTTPALHLQVLTHSYHTLSACTDSSSPNPMPGRLDLHNNLIPLFVRENKFNGYNYVYKGAFGKWLWIRNTIVRNTYHPLGKLLEIPRGLLCISNPYFYMWPVIFLMYTNHVIYKWCEFAVVSGRVDGLQYEFRCSMWGGAMSLRARTQAARGVPGRLRLWGRCACILPSSYLLVP